MEHKHANLLRMAADNEDQLFECCRWKNKEINWVTDFPNLNWSPVKQTKIIKKWLWADSWGRIKDSLLTDKEVERYNEVCMPQFKLRVKLLWSETEFEVNDE